MSKYSNNIITIFLLSSLTIIQYTFSSNPYNQLRQPSFKLSPYAPSFNPPSSTTTLDNGNPYSKSLNVTYDEDEMIQDNSSQCQFFIPNLPVRINSKAYWLKVRDLPHVPIETKKQIIRVGLMGEIILKHPIDILNNNMRNYSKKISHQVIVTKQEKLLSFGVCYMLFLTSKEQKTLNSQEKMNVDELLCATSVSLEPLASPSESSCNRSPRFQFIPDPSLSTPFFSPWDPTIPSDSAEKWLLKSSKREPRFPFIPDLSRSTPYFSPWDPTADIDLSSAWLN